MKTKIIYISGSEIFNMHDVRNAFETVRRELGLSQDTVLFGVPVDTDDALNGQFEPVESQTFVPEKPVDDKPVIDTPVIETPIVEPVPEKKAKRTKKKTATVVEQAVEEETQTVTEEKPQVDVPKEPETTEEVIPILSVLGAGNQATDTTDQQKTEDITPDNDNNDVEQNIGTDEIDETDVVTVDEPDTTLVIHTETVVTTTDVTDINDDEIPTIEPQTATLQERDEDDIQLEKLLQSVQSLNEDQEEPKATEPELKVLEPEPDETDATLEKLATEFAENQDKIVNTTKNTTRAGRIGKLKNILPFKKAKNSDSSLMGDLFGWAGVAANDEEFGIPEFFPTR